MQITELDASQAVTWLFSGAATLIGSLLLTTIRKLANGVEDLNVKIAHVIEKTMNHEKELGRHDERIGYLERQ